MRAGVLAGVLSAGVVAASYQGWWTILGCALIGVFCGLALPVQRRQT